MFILRSWTEITVQSCKEHNLKYEVFSSFEVDLSGTVEENFINYQKIAEEMLGGQNVMG